MASGKRILGIIGLSLCLVVLATSTAFSQEAAEESQQAEGQAAAKPASEFEGPVKVGYGKYFYMPSAQGYDIAVQGQIGSGDASQLTGKDVRVKGELLVDKPSIFRADSIEVKDASGSYTNLFTRTQDLVVDDCLDSAARDSFKELVITGPLKTEEWEGKGQAKIYGQLQTTGAVTYVILSDIKGKEIGRIIVDGFTDYATYYVKKLRLFDKFWFYLNIKGTVDRAVRNKTKELFHADAVFCGLY